MTTFRRSMTAALCLSFLSVVWALSSPAEAQPGYSPSVGERGKDVIWVPTPQTLVDRMLDMAEVSRDDYLVDLGSGDGRTVITAAKRGVRAHGIEFNGDMVEYSKRAAEAEGVAERATFEQADIFESDFSSATVVTLFLLPQLNVRLRPTLLEMAPGTRVVSNTFTMGDWEPDGQVMARGDCDSYCHAYKWIVPAKVEGSWRWEGGELSLRQTYQMIEGALRLDGRWVPIQDARLRGAEIAFKVGAQRYEARVDGNTMKGTVDGKADWEAVRSMRRAGT